MGLPKDPTLTQQVASNVTHSEIRKAPIVMYEGSPVRFWYLFSQALTCRNLQSYCRKQLSWILWIHMATKRQVTWPLKQTWSCTSILLFFMQMLDPDTDEALFLDQNKENLAAYKHSSANEGKETCNLLNVFLPAASPVLL